MISLRTLLVLVTLAAIIAAISITPRLRRFRTAQRLERDCLTLSHIYRSEPNMLDNLLGTDGEVLHIGFWGTKEPVSLNVLTANCLGLLSTFKSIETLEIENVLIEAGAAFPSVSNRIRILNVEGHSLDLILEQLISKQSRLAAFEIERVPEFSDAHVSRLAGIKDLREIMLSDVSVTGEGFEAFTTHQCPVHLLLAGSLVSADGLRCIVTCKAIKDLSLFLECNQVGALVALQHADPSMNIFAHIPKDCKVDLGMTRMLEGFAERLENLNLVYAGAGPEDTDIRERQKCPTPIWLTRPDEAAANPSAQDR